MTLEEAKELAEQKDIGAILALAKFYYEDENNRDYAEALKWYHWGAKCGDVQCMLFSAHLGLLLATVKNRISPDDIDGQLELLQEAMSWAENAVRSGENSVEDTVIEIREQIGLVNYQASLYTNTEEQRVFRLNEAVNALSMVYEKAATSKCRILLGLSLYSRLHLLQTSSKEEESWTYNLLYSAVQSGEEGLPFLEVAYAFLGNMCTVGQGCPVDYDKAYHFYFEASQRGFECMDMLKRFKKKLFGGYTLV